MLDPLSKDQLVHLFNFEINQILLDNYFFPIAKFTADNKDAEWEKGLADHVASLLGKKGYINKSDIVNICAKIYSNGKILKSYFNSLNDVDKQVFLKAIWKPKVSAEELKEIFGQDVFDVEESLLMHNIRRNFQITYIENLGSWKLNIYNNSHELKYIYLLKEFSNRLRVWLAFPMVKRRIFASYLPKPKGFEFYEAVLPQNTLKFGYEEKVFQEFPLLIAYYLQKNIQYTQKGIPTIPSIRKMTKTLNLEKFPLKIENELRNTMLAGLLSDNFKVEKLTENPLSILRDLFDQSKIEDQLLTPILLPNLKGINRLSSYDFKQNIASEIWEIIQSLPVNTWVSKNNLITYAETHFINLDVMYEYMVNNFGNILQKENKFNNYPNRVDAEKTVFIPNFIGHLYLMAAFGLMEIGIDPEKELEHSYYDNFAGCKLTKLGAYVLKKIDEYEVPDIYEGAKIIFEENSLLIRIEGNVEIAAATIGNYALKVSEHMYQFSPELFLKDCKTTDILKKKIHLFKTTTSGKLPAFWLEYLDNLIVNSKAITQKLSMVVFKLPQDNKELIKLIAQDSELKKIIIKAEQFHVLVERSQYNAFISRMKHFGFLINPK